MARHTFLAQLAGLPFLSLGTKAQESKKLLKIMMKSPKTRQRGTERTLLCPKSPAGLRGL